jgi:ketosteroid isomerase-like protein
MKLSLFLTLIMAALSSLGQSNDESAVRKVLADQQASWNRGNINDFMQGYWKSDSLTFTGKNGVTYGWTKTLNNYKRNYPDTASMGKLTFTIVNVDRLSGDLFHLIGKWQLRRSIGNLEGHFTVIFRKINGQWVIIADHSS